VSRQRKRGQLITVYFSKTIEDARGNKSLVVDLASGTPEKAFLMPKRGARAEVPGQAQIRIMTMQVDPDVQGIDLWSRVGWDGRFWDVVSPPALWYGTRHTRHWSIDIRLRP
jgi:hypothetical protein